mgnify:CR=1 FL=1
MGIASRLYGMHLHVYISLFAWLYYIMETTRGQRDIESSHLLPMHCTDKENKQGHPLYCPLSTSDGYKTTIRVDNPAEGISTGHSVVFLAHLKNNTIPDVTKSFWTRGKTFYIDLDASIVAVNKTTGEVINSHHLNTMDIIAAIFDDRQYSRPAEIGRISAVPGDVYYELRIKDAIVQLNGKDWNPLINALIGGRLLMSFSSYTTTITLEGFLYPSTNRVHVLIFMSTLIMLIAKLRQHRLFSKATLVGLAAACIGCLNTQWAIKLLRPDNESKEYSLGIVTIWQFGLAELFIQLLALRIVFGGSRNWTSKVFFPIFLFVLPIFKLVVVYFQHTGSMDTYEDKGVYKTRGLRVNKMLGFPRENISVIAYYFTMTLLVLAIFRRAKSEVASWSLGLFAFCAKMFFLYSQFSYTRTLEFDPTRRLMQLSFIPVFVITLQGIMAAREPVIAPTGKHKDKMCDLYYLPRIC